MNNNMGAHEIRGNKGTKYILSWEPLSSDAHKGRKVYASHKFAFTFVSRQHFVLEQVFCDAGFFLFRQQENVPSPFLIDWKQSVEIQHRCPQTLLGLHASCQFWMAQSKWTAAQHVLFGPKNARSGARIYVPCSPGTLLSIADVWMHPRAFPAHFGFWMPTSDMSQVVLAKKALYFRWPSRGTVANKGWHNMTLPCRQPLVFTGQSKRWESATGKTDCKLFCGDGDSRQPERPVPDSQKRNNP